MVESPTAKLPAKKTVSGSLEPFYQTEGPFTTLLARYQIVGRIENLFDNSIAPAVNSDDMVALYFNEIRQYPILTRDEERRLGILINTYRDKQQEKKTDGSNGQPVIETDDPGFIASSEAQSILFKCNLRWVAKLATRKLASVLPLLDLISEGNLGLITAVQKYDYRKGTVTNYSKYWINQYMDRHIRNFQDSYRLPAGLAEKLVRARRIQYNYMTANGVEPPIPLIAEKIGLSVAKTKRLLNFQGSLSLDQGGFSTDGEELAPLIERLHVPEGDFDEEAILQQTLADRLDAILSALPARHKRVLELRYGIGDRRGEKPLKLIEIGQRFNLTRERIRQLEDEALERLRVPHRSEEFNDFRR